MKTFFTCLFLFCSTLAIHAQECLQLFLYQVSGLPGEDVEVALSTAGFQDIVSMQFSINYDPDQISFIGMQELNLPGLHPSNIGNPAPGNI
ncbi:MAG: hypothetical protein KDC34_09005, partial [Saprospiraceae bacterium]|nr:hypothetical protein [Saprospiraceae bacterium]